MASKTGSKSKNGQNTKIRKYRKPLNLNIGMLIFAVIFIYVCGCVLLYFQTSHIVRYEVQKGSLATNNIYRGVILRDETVITTDKAVKAAKNPVKKPTYNFDKNTSLEDLQKMK